MAENSSSPTEQRLIVILGGSYGGLSTAHYLLKHAVPALPDRDKYSYVVTLVSASSKALDRPACPRALISDDLFDQQKLFTDIPKQLEQYPKEDVQFLQGTATRLDHVSRSVEVTLKDGGTEKLNYYALVIATGASTTSPLLSLNKDEDSLHESWETFRKALPDAKTIVVAGGGPAGIETAGELGEHINGQAGWFASRLENPKVNITVVTAADHILPHLRRSLGLKAEGFLARVGVTVTKNSRVKSVAPEGAGTDAALTSKATVTLEDGKTLEADLYIPAMGTRPNTSFVDGSLLADDGRVETDGYLRVKAAGPRVYAVGDVCSFYRPAVHLTVDAIPILCSNIKRDLLLGAGKTDTEVAKDRKYEENKKETQMVPIGTSKGVGAAFGYALPSILIWLLKGRDYWMWTLGPLWSGKQWAKES